MLESTDHLRQHNLNLERNMEFFIMGFNTVSGLSRNTHVIFESIITFRAL